MKLALLVATLCVLSGVKANVLTNEREVNLFNTVLKIAMWYIIDVAK